MAIEKYIAAASLGLFVMFVAETITVYTFIIDPQEGLEAIEPAPKMWQFISIGVAPAVIMVSVSFIMVKSSGSKQIAIMIVAGGIILFTGMVYSYTLLDYIAQDYLVPTVVIIPPLFMAVSIPVIFIGALLFRKRIPSRKKDYV